MAKSRTMNRSLSAWGGMSHSKTKEQLLFGSDPASSIPYRMGPASAAGDEGLAQNAAERLAVSLMPSLGHTTFPTASLTSASLSETQRSVCSMRIRSAHVAPRLWKMKYENAFKLASNFQGTASNPLSPAG